MSAAEMKVDGGWAEIASLWLMEEKWLGLKMREVLVKRDGGSGREASLLCGRREHTPGTRGRREDHVVVVLGLRVKLLRKSRPCLGPRAVDTRAPATTR